MLFTILDAVADCLDRESARKLVKLNFEKQILDRRVQLNAKGRKVSLTEEEQAQLILLSVFDYFLAHLQRRARAILRRRS